MDLFLVWICTFVSGFYIFKKFKEWQNLPPGPWGLPILGYLPFINQKQPHATLVDLSKKYGPIYGISMGNIYAVVLSDAKLIRESLAKDNFSGRAPLYLTHGIMQGNGIICAEGPLWRDQRKLVSVWLRNFGMSKHSVSREKLEKRIASGVYEMLENIESSKGRPQDLAHMLTNSLGNFVNDIIFGFKFPQDDKTWHWFRQIQEEGCHEMGVAGAVNFLPFVRFFSSSIRKTIDVITRGTAQTHRLYATMIAKRRKILGIEQPKGAEYEPHRDLFKDNAKGHIKCIKYSKYAKTVKEHYFDPEILIQTDGECILDNFLIEQKKRFEEGDENCKFMTDEQMHFLLADMFGAGLDTTSVTMSWFLLFMARYPEEQEIVRKEIQSVFKEGEIVEHSRLPKLMAALCETQRLRSILPVGLPHGCVEDTYIGKYKVPKGAMIMPLQWALHMDPEIWEDPKEFRPSRFLAPDGSLLKPPEFIPFQTGKRMCPGDELSRMVSCGLITRLFSKWKVRLESEPSEEDLEGHMGLTLSPPHVMFYCDPL